MRGKTLEVAMLADVSGAYNTISNVYQCVSMIMIGQANVNGVALQSWL